MARRAQQLSWWARATVSVAVDLLPGQVNVAIRRSVLHANLRRLNDVLAGTPLHERYWLDGGLLLGWARGGDALANDLRDVDFGVLAEDFPRVLAATATLEAAGFSILHVVEDDQGQPLSAHFRRGGVQFDFVKAVPEGDKLVMQGTAEVPVRVTYERPRAVLGKVRLFGREWLKPQDHESALAAHYGDWRAGWRPDWSTPRDSPSVVAWEPTGGWAPWRGRSEVSADGRLDAGAEGRK